MTITAAAVVPHPPIILPAIGKGEEKKIADIDAAYKEAAQTIRDTNPETLVILSPHAPAYADYFQIADKPRLKGDLSMFGDAQDRFDVKNDLDLVREISRLADEAGFPAGTLGKQDGTLDHGTMIPLAYFQPEQIVRIGTAGLSNRNHYKLGRLIQQAADNLGKRIAVLASADLSHCQKAGTHYGYKPCGPAYDKTFMDIVAKGDFQTLLAIPDQEADAAMVCGQKPMCILAGTLDGQKPASKALAHSAEFGVGYGVGTFTNLEPDNSRRYEAQLQVPESTDPLVQAAKAVIESHLTGKPMPDFKLDQAPAGCFVSLHEGGRLRGCIGTTGPTRDTFEKELMHNAIAAALQDPRFPPVQPCEVPDLEINVDVLNPPEDIEDQCMLDPKKYGVIVSAGRRRGLLLPDLEGVDTIEDQVRIARQKGSIRENEPVTLQRFTVTRHK